MDFLINTNELQALSGLPHWQQLTYLRGIRPYMDVQSGITGIKRKISLQSLTEELYIEPHQGIKAESFSRAQVRRAVAALERAGLITNQSKEKQLILKCELATRAYSVQNKAITNPSQKAVTNPSQQNLITTPFSEEQISKADIAEPPKADTPLKEDNYIYLLGRFEAFWQVYPVKKSRDRTFEVFQQLNPDEQLLKTMLKALKNQIDSRLVQQVSGNWLPPWKYPANWLAQKCWEDEINFDVKQEKSNAANRKDSGSQRVTGGFYIPDEDEDGTEEATVLQFRKI